MVGHGEWRFLQGSGWYISQNKITTLKAVMLEWEKNEISNQSPTSLGLMKTACGERTIETQ